MDTLNYLLRNAAQLFETNYTLRNDLFTLAEQRWEAKPRRDCLPTEEDDTDRACELYYLRLKPPELGENHPSGKEVFGLCFKFDDGTIIIKGELKGDGYLELAYSPLSSGPPPADYVRYNVQAERQSTLLWWHQRLAVFNDSFEVSRKKLRDVYCSIPSVKVTTFDSETVKLVVLSLLHKKLALNYDEAASRQNLTYGNLVIDCKAAVRRVLTSLLYSLAVILWVILLLCFKATRALDKRYPDLNSSDRLDEMDEIPLPDTERMVANISSLIEHRINTLVDTVKRYSALAAKYGHLALHASTIFRFGGEEMIQTHLEAHTHRPVPAFLLRVADEILQGVAMLELVLLILLLIPVYVEGLLHLAALHMFAPCFQVHGMAAFMIFGVALGVSCAASVLLPFWSAVLLAPLICFLLLGWSIQWPHTSPTNIPSAEVSVSTPVDEWNRFIDDLQLPVAPLPIEAGPSAFDTSKQVGPRVLDSLQLDKQLKCRLFNEEELHECQNFEPASGWSDAFDFPSPESLRTLAQAAYDKKNAGDLGDWKLVMTAQSSILAGFLECFFAQVYLKPKGNQLLVAIKGTTKSNPADLLADLKNLIMKKRELQVDSVFTFGEELRKLIAKFKTKPQVIITGHSLGGLLAQVLTFTLRNCGSNGEGQAVDSINDDDFGLNTYVFDSPAASMQILRIAKSIWDPVDFSRFLLPVTNFVITPNLITSNTIIGPHLGTMITLSSLEDLKYPSKYQRIKSIPAHGLKNFVNKLVDLGDASLVKHLPSAFDTRRIPLLQFSGREQDSLRLIALSDRVEMNFKSLIQATKLNLKDNEVHLKYDESEFSFIPKLRFFVQHNEEELRNLAAKLHEQFSSLMQRLLNAHAKDFNDLDLRLKPEVAQRYREMASGSSIKGLDDEREQMLFARILKNSLDHYLFVNFNDFIGFDEMQRETWLRLNEGTLMLCQANGRRLDESKDRKTKIFYVDSANHPVMSTPENCTSRLPEIRPEEQEPLKVTDLDEESRMKLKERKLGFFGNEVEAGKIFLDLFEDLKVRDVVDFTCQAKDRELTFYFNQSLKKTRINEEFTVRNLVSDIKKSDLQTLFLISCNAGMGKSVNLRKFETSLQKSLPHFWVVRLELASCSETLQKWTQILERGKSQSSSNTSKIQKSIVEDKISRPLNSSEQRPHLSGQEVDQETDFVEDAIAIIADEMFKGTSEKYIELQRKVFASKVTAGEVIFMLDAVDEVCPLYRDAPLELLRQLKKTKLSIVVATRPQEEQEVAVALEIKKEDILRLQLIDDRDQAQFIHQFWESKGISSGLESAESLLDQLRSRLPAGVPGVPLNLRMIAETFPDGKLSEEFKQHGDLFKTLFGISISEAIKLKFGLDKNVAVQRFDHDKNATKYFKLLQKIAVADELGEEKSLLEEEIEFINRLPFAVVVGAEVRFTHKTFQEYLIAIQLVRVMKDDKDKQEVCLSEEKSKIILSDKGSREIRSYIDMILSHTQCSASAAQKFFSEEIALFCLEEQHLNIFKLLCYDKSICNNRIGKGKKHPLKVILDNKQLKREFFEYLISQGARLEDAVNEENCDEMLRGLIQAGLNECIVEKWNLFESTLEAVHNPLVFAIQCRNHQSARFLIKKGACVDKFDKFGEHTPLSAAIKNDDLEIVQLLLEYKARVTIEDFLSGKRTCVKILSEHITSFNARDVNGRTLLMRAAEKGNADCVRFLLEKGFDPYEKDKEGRTCLYYTLIGSNYNHMGQQNVCFKILFELIAAPQEEKNKLLFVAAEERDEEVLTFLMENGANPSAVDENGNTALHIAAGREDSRGCIEVLLRGGADPNARNKEGRTPLHSAAASGSEVNCKALIEAKVQVDSRDNKGMTPLMLAARSNKIYRIEKVVKTLLTHGADPSLQDHQGWNCLHHAADFGSGKAVSVLCDNKIRIDSRCRGGMTPLMIAAKNDNSKVVEVLLKDGADPSLVDEKGWNCLHNAAANGSDECVKILRKQGVSLASKTVEGKTAFKLAEENGFVLTAQHLLGEGVEMDSSFNSKMFLENAIKENDVEKIEILCKNRKRVEAREFVLAAECGHLNLLRLFEPLVESVDVKNWEGNTALMEAAWNNNVECVKFLLKKGADPNEKVIWGGTSLDYAAWGSASECFEILFDRVDEKNINLERLLHMAARGGNLKKFLLLLEKGADLRVLYKIDDTCLHSAARNKNPECLEYLLRNHLHLFDVNERNIRKQTALHCAAEKGGVEHLQFLMQNGADVTARDGRGWTALYFAAASGRTENCEFLLKYIPVDSRDIEGKTPLMWAAESGKNGTPRVIKVLLDAGADPKLQDENGWNCLHIAAFHGLLENVKVLCERVPLEAKNKKGETALQIAEGNYYTAAVLRAKIAERAQVP